MPAEGATQCAVTNADSIECANAKLQKYAFSLERNMANIILSLKDRAQLLKLFLLNSSNTVVSLCEFRRA